MWLSQGFFLVLLSITAKVQARRRKVTAPLGFLLDLTLWSTCSWFQVVWIYSNEFGQSACSTFVSIFTQLPAHIFQIRRFCSASTRQVLLQLFTHYEMIFWGFSGPLINLVPFLKWIFLNLFIFNWLIYLFLAALGLRCCAQAFSSCGERTSHGGFSCCGAQALGTRASVVVARGLSSCGSRALERRLSSYGAQA